MTYTLMALETLAFFHDISVAVSTNTPVVQLKEDLLERFVNLFTGFSATQLALSDIHTHQ